MLPMMPHCAPVAMSGMVEKMGARNMLCSHIHVNHCPFRALKTESMTSFGISGLTCSELSKAPEEEERGADDGGEAGATALANRCSRLDVGGERRGAQQAAEGRAHAVSNESPVALRAHQTRASATALRVNADHAVPTNAVAEHGCQRQ